MELFTRLFENVLLFMYHCFDRVVIHGYLSGLSRPEQAVYFFRDVIGEPMISKEVLSRRTQQYQAWVEAYARNHKIPIEWAEKGVRKEDYLRPELHQMERRNDHGVYFILKSMEQGAQACALDRPRLDRLARFLFFFFAPNRLNRVQLQ